MSTPRGEPPERMVYSHITKTPIPYKERWKNATYKREYLQYWRLNVKRDWALGKHRNVKRTTVIPQPPRSSEVGQETCEVCGLTYEKWKRNLHRSSALHKTRVIEQFVEKYQLMGFDRLCSMVEELLLKTNEDDEADETDDTVIPVARLQPTTVQFNGQVRGDSVQSTDGSNQSCPVR